MFWLLFWPISGLIIWGWCNYSVYVAKEQNGQKVPISNFQKIVSLTIFLLTGPVSLVLAILLFSDGGRDGDLNISPKFGFKIW